MARRQGDVARTPAEAEKPTRVPPPPQPVLEDPDRARVLYLQRTAGNAAVGRALSLASRPVISRYEAGEHAQFGGATDLKLKDLPDVTEGDLIAMGDFFEKPEDMMAADPAELKELVRLIHKDRTAYETGKAADRVSNDEWEGATAGRKTGKKFLELAEENAAHFAPRPPGTGGATFLGQLGGTIGGIVGLGAEGEAAFGRVGAAVDQFAAQFLGPDNHKRQWQKLHAQALDKAAGKGSVPAEAVAVNGFASHFLTDAFSAGHLLPKQDVMEKAGKKWDDIATKGGDTDFAQKVAKGVFADPGASKTLSGYELDLPLTMGRTWEPVTASNFAELLGRIALLKRDKFLNAFAKLVHDKLDDEIKTGKGIEVENDAGDSWGLSGDKTLGLSAQTKTIGSAAVAAASKNLEDAAKSKGPPDYATMFERVWRFTPRTTAAGRSRVDKILEQFTDAADPATVNAFVALTVEELPLAIRTLEAQNYMRKKAAAPATGGTPTPAPAGTP